MTTIAFIGLGNMGNPMAANLVKAGHRVLGFDLSTPRSPRRAKHGVDRRGTAPTPPRQADVVITMLPAGKHVLSAL